jgi:hypothetical protein
MPATNQYYRSHLIWWTLGAGGLILLILSSLVSHHLDDATFTIPTGTSSSASLGITTIHVDSNIDASWQEAKELLCPHNIPQVDRYANLLFNLSARELFDDSYNDEGYQPPNVPNFNKKGLDRIHQFFSGPVDHGTKLCRMPDDANNVHVLYM